VPAATAVAHSDAPGELAATAAHVASEAASDAFDRRNLVGDVTAHSAADTPAAVAVVAACEVGAQGSCMILWQRHVAAAAAAAAAAVAAAFLGCC